MKLASETKSDKFINRHQIHIYNRQLNRYIFLFLMPFYFVFHLFLKSHVRRTTEAVILFITFMIVQPIVAQLLGAWIHKKPRSSKWYWLYYNN